MARFNDDLIGLLTLNEGIQRGLQLKKRYNFSEIFNNQKKIIKRDHCNKTIKNLGFVMQKTAYGVINILLMSFTAIYGKIKPWKCKTQKKIINFYCNKIIRKRR